MRVGGKPNPEMDVRLRVLDVAALSEGADGLALEHGGSTGYCRGAEVQHGHGEAVRRLDRHRPAASRHRAGERDGTRGRRVHGHAACATDVDAAMLIGRVRVVSELELLQHRPTDGPGPGGGGRCPDQERDEDREQNEVPVHRSPPLSLLRTERA